MKKDKVSKLCPFFLLNIDLDTILYLFHLFYCKMRKTSYQLFLAFLVIR